jgi:PST family polysaccharide transporter
MIITKLKQLSANQFVQNVSWLGAAELINRIFRLSTTVTLARLFSSKDYGAVAVIYTLFEIISTLTLAGGIGAKVVQAQDEDLDDICNTSYWLGWLISGTLFVLQALAAFPIAHFYQDPQLVLPIMALGLSYLMFPQFNIQGALLERDNQLQVKAWCNITQAGISNFLIVILALLGFRVWAIVPPLVASYLGWIIITHRAQPWRPSGFRINRWRDILGFSSKAVGIELLGRIRRNVDYLIVGRFLGMEALGIYFFAFNAGLGISQSVLNALTAAWYPHFCEARGDRKQLKRRFLGSFKAIALTILPLVIVQSLAAPFYVPIIFGTKWGGAVPILILICFSAIPISLYESNARLLLALDKLTVNLQWNVFFSILFTVSLLSIVPLGITGVAAMVLVSQAMFVPIFTAWVMKTVFANGDA